MAKKPPTEGTCPDCGRWIALAESGAVINHLDRRKRWTAVCRGSRTEPTKTR